MSQLSLTHAFLTFSGFQTTFWASKLLANRFSKKYNALTPYDQNQWAQFVCSFMKGTLVCAKIYPVVWLYWPKISEFDSFEGGIKGTAVEQPLYVFLGYALSDTISVISQFDSSKGDTPMLIHHIITAGGWIYLLVYDFGRDIACIACMVEISTPLLAVRWFMALFELKTGPLYVINGLLILISWWILRVFLFVVFFGYKLYYVMRLSVPRDIPVVVAWTIGSALQVFWAYKLTVGFAKVARKTLSKRKRK